VFCVSVRLNLLFHYYVFVCISPGKAVPEMTYTVSGGTLNSTHSLTLYGKPFTELQSVTCHMRSDHIAVAT